MPTEQPALALARIIEQTHETIVNRWLERVRRDITTTPGVELTQLRDGLPDYLAALVRLLRSKAPTLDSVGATRAWMRVAGEHGITRVRLGFDITQLVHEFVVLRQVIREILAEHGARSDDTEAILADTLDGAISASVRSYVETRDFEIRRKQAKHVGFLIHELRNPLSTAMLAASKLGEVAPPDAAHLLEKLDRNHRKLNALIDSVLLTEKMEAGTVTPHPAPIRLGPLMAPALEGARAVAAKKEIGFHANYDPSLEVRVDPDLTRSALQNIADNAVRYTDEGDVHVTVERAKDEVVVHVRDACPGISDEELQTIFEPFERGRTGKSGTGLGLAIARRAIEAQGGSIGAESPGPSGCHFWIRLPV